MNIKNIYLQFIYTSFNSLCLCVKLRNSVNFKDMNILVIDVRYYYITTQTIDKKFMSAINYDVKRGTQQVSTSVASVSTREIQQIQPTHQVYPEIDVGEEFRIDTKPFINRPFFVEIVPWNATSPIYTSLPINFSELPKDIINSNDSLKNAVKLGAYYRSDLMLNISVAGTITHAGTILAGILPPLPVPVNDVISQYNLINTIMSGPHGFLSANEATSISLHVPWYCNSDLATLDFSETDGAIVSTDITVRNGNYGTLVLLVLNPLTPSDASSATLDIVVEAMFNSLDILVPSPKYITYTFTPPTSMTGQSFIKNIVTGVIDEGVSFAKSTMGDAIDNMRDAMRKFTGLHNPNYAKMSDKVVVSPRNYGNVVDSTQYFEKLDPYSDIDRIMQRPDFHTLEDEMDLQHIVGKSQFLGTFRVNAQDQTGILLWSRPISPYQGFPLNNGIFANNIQLMHYLSRGWRGSINIHIQSVMNNKQQAKLRLIQLYNPSVAIASSYPTYRSILNAPSHLMEFTAGGQLQTINLPYLCRNNITPCMRDNVAESLFHGEYYIYLAQAMANSGGSPQDIYFNVFISLGEDFKFYGYSTELITMEPPVNYTLGMQGQSIEVMNEPQQQNELVENNQKEEPEETFSDRLKPLKSVRDIIRRMYKVDAVPITVNAQGRGIYSYNLSTLISEAFVSDNFVTPAQAVAHMYYGKHAGLKFKVKVSNSVNFNVRYLPPNFYVDQATSTVQGCKPNTTALTDNIYEYTNTPNYPLPFVEYTHISQTRMPGLANSSVYEFIIPNTTFYKFLGGPNKMTGNAGTLSTTDLGTLLFIVDVGPEEQTENNDCILSIYYGFTDESRLGFHCIAPVVFPAQESNFLDTLYSGNFAAGSATQPSTINNAFLYFTRN